MLDENLFNKAETFTNPCEYILSFVVTISTWNHINSKFVNVYKFEVFSAKCQARHTYVYRMCKEKNVNNIAHNTGMRFAILLLVCMI